MADKKASTKKPAPEVSEDVTTVQSKAPAPLVLYSVEASRRARITEGTLPAWAENASVKILSFVFKAEDDVPAGSVVNLNTLPSGRHMILLASSEILSDVDIDVGHRQFKSHPNYGGGVVKENLKALGADRGCWVASSTTGIQILAKTKEPMQRGDGIIGYFSYVTS